MKKIVAFGDSFIFGSEIEDNTTGAMGWPGLAAQDLATDFCSCAQPGCGNTRILQQILQYFTSHATGDTLAVVNWTWALRWDILLDNHDHWITVGPTCTKEKLGADLGKDAELTLRLYEELVSSRPYQSVFNTLQCMVVALHFFQTHQIPFIQTYMDHRVFAPSLHGSLLEFYQDLKLPDWPVAVDQSEFDRLPLFIQQEIKDGFNTYQNPAHFLVLQQMVKCFMSDFQGKNFLDWSRDLGFEVTPEPGLHPLLESHRAAADLWRDRYAQALA